MIVNYKTVKKVLQEISNAVVGDEKILADVLLVSHYISDKVTIVYEKPQPSAEIRKPIDGQEKRIRELAAQLEASERQRAEDLSESRKLRSQLEAAGERFTKQPEDILLEEFEHADTKWLGKKILELNQRRWNTTDYINNTSLLSTLLLSSALMLTLEHTVGVSDADYLFIMERFTKSLSAFYIDQVNQLTEQLGHGKPNPR